MKKYIVILIISLPAIANLLYINKTNHIQQNVSWNVYTTEKAIELPRDEKLYNCKMLKAVIGQDLKYCILKDKRPVEVNKVYVMGEFNSLLNRITVSQETRNSSRVHEFLHYVVSCVRETNQEELCVRSGQKMLEELNYIN